MGKITLNGVWNLHRAGDANVWIGRALGNPPVGIIRRIDFKNLDFEVVLAGSFYNGGPLITESMGEVILEIAPGVKLVRLDAPPVVGAVMLSTV